MPRTLPRIWPKTLPGDFFVLTFDRETGNYDLIVDDIGVDHPEPSSYKLGDDIETVMLYFRVIGLKELGNRAIDAAREFGQVQAIPSDGRVIRIPARGEPQRGNQREEMFNDESDADRVINLPYRF